MPFAPRDSVYVDESKAKGYILVASAVEPGTIAEVERTIRSFRLSGQRRIHFTKERDSRRRSILAAWSQLPVRVIVYRTSEKSDKTGRALTLGALIDDLVSARASRLVLEADASLITADRRFIQDRLAVRQAHGALRYEHSEPALHPLLWLSDAVAWCSQAGGEWSSRAAALVEEQRVL